MSADHDGDSQMLSSASSSTGPATPPLNQQSAPTSSTLSPPDSQHRSMANANGKRPLNTISNGPDNDDDEAVIFNNALPQTQQQAQAQMQRPGKAPAEFPTKTHAGSGYTWNRKEDEPGHAWLNKKAIDEYHRAHDSLLHKDHTIKGRYGDPFEVADKERAMLSSLRQQ